jgi:hypothetical protein
MDALALAIDLVLFGVFTIGLIVLSFDEARHGKKVKEELRKVA